MRGSRAWSRPRQQRQEQCSTILSLQQHVLLIDVDLNFNLNRFSSYFFVQIFSGS
jgi:hypothetical protein